ncbi:MAG TPA: hypothetical protein PLY40_02355 [Bacillota bacterium]|nr:hypothetical protein [Bacillota bacterium]
MVKQNERRSMLKWLGWTVFILLLLVVGLGPLALLISYTWDENISAGSIWDIFRGNSHGNDQIHELVPEEFSPEPFMVQYLNRYCTHSEVFPPGNIPAGYPEPPQAITEIAVALQKNNLAIDDLMEELKNPQDWHLADLKEGCGRPFFILTHLGEFCPRCNEQFYLGIFKLEYEDKIAVYQGSPPNGKLIEITDIQVKDIFRQELEKGVMFESEEKKRMYLEDFSS